MKFSAEFKVMRLREIAPVAQANEPSQIVEFWRSSVPQAQWFNPDAECFVTIFLNTRRWISGFSLVSIGTLDTILVHPREVFKPAIVMGASALVLAHNHPSGDPTPSEADIKVTRDLIKAGQILKIEVLDHIIMGKVGPLSLTGYASLRELGYFYA